MARELPDRSDRLFGREGDLANLLERARFKGLTAVVARPQMGKSWLLTELARRLAREHEPPHLVGFAESFGETPDLLLRTVVDLYARWLSDAGAWERAKKVWQNEKANLLPSFAKTVAKIFKETNPATKPLAVAVEEAITSLIAADERLRTGGLQLPTLSYEQARDLVGSVAEISGRPIALFLDQWEKSPDAALESKTLDAFLRHLDDWPACHIFMALRPDDPAHAEVEKLAASLPGAAEIYPLADMKLDLDEGRRLTAFVRGIVPAAQGQSDTDLLDLVGGFPGVLYRWTSDYQREHMETLSHLESVARDAQEYRFGELQQLLPGLKDDEKRMAIRLALLPPGDGSIWDANGGEVLGDLDATLIDDLRLARVLESADPPSFGHAKRWEGARVWFVSNQRNSTRSEARGLISRVAARVREPDLAVLPNVALLFALLPTARELKLDDLAQAFCQAAASIFRAFGVVDNTLIRGAKDAELGDSLGMPLLAIGLVNTLIYAKAKDDLARRDDLLDELRTLANAHPETAAVRKWLAIGLFNVLTYAKAEDDLARRDALLDELRALANAHPEDPAVREWLASGLFNTLNHAKAEEALARRDALLEELRALAGAHPEEAAVREWLAKGLYNTLNHAMAKDALARRDALLEELRALAKAHPEDAAVREKLAVGLFNTLNDAKAENDLARRDALLEELRDLAGAHPEDAAVREWVTKGIVNTLDDVKMEGNLARSGALLEGLRALARAHAKDRMVRGNLAKGLYNTLKHAKAGEALECRDRLLGELRGLAQAHPQDVTLREPLARGLVQALNDAKAEGDMARRDARLEELRALAKAHTEDAAVREKLAVALFNTLNDAKAENDLARRDALLEELGALATDHPEDGWVEQFRSAGLLA